MARPFKGEIKLDIRDSRPDWDAFLAPKAPKDAPNVLVILYDDTGYRGKFRSRAGGSSR
jgi:arylsulfatase